MTDYQTDVHTLSLNADYQATEQFGLNAGLMFSDAKAEWSGLSLQTPANVNDPVLTNIYSLEATNVITSYSELHYRQLEASLGGTYQFTPALYVAASVGYVMFDDRSPYVYGDQDGDAYRGSLGLGYRF
ncbi:MAG: hypothetical protein RQ723_08165 [Desulfuromonadales bacterium]|nr:hypothetical protein [Desulfuromonadales bacterium]